MEIVQTRAAPKNRNWLNMIDLKSTSFSHHIQVVKPGKIHAQLQGRLLDKHSGMKLYADLELALAKEKNAHVLLDVINLDYINSEGLNTLIRCLSLTRKKGGELWITQANQLLNSLFLSTRLSDLFASIDTPKTWLELPHD
jgi:anti-anti-sigma factor